MSAVLRLNKKNFQYASLLLLALQSASLTLMMKLSRGKFGQASYDPASVVCVVELVKLLCSFFMEMFLNRGGSPRRTVTAILTDVLNNPREVMKLGVPAFLYAIQNNLCYLALSHLSALNYQVIYQMKILTTALFSVWLLGKKLSHRHWAALFLLMAGVVAVQMAGTQKSSLTDKSSTWTGFVVLLFNSASSGYAGVFFEQLSKKRRSSANPKSVWLQSFELGSMGLMFSLCVAFFGSTSQTLKQQGFFYGYNQMTWFTIALQSLGGILVALVIRHADNIQKAFATSLSIVLCSLVSVGMLGHQLSSGLISGTVLVAISIVLYAKAESQVKPSRSRLPRSKHSSSNLLEAR